MLIVKIVGIAFITLFIMLLFKQSKNELNTFLVLTAGALILLIMIEPLRQVIDFVKEIADKANIDMVYIGIVLKILAIAYSIIFKCIM
ncbi:threonine/homoserine efflux transporter RhtA [Clostridium beijerinckii]|nr:threonine/homoserine efflux transporter RhtA [Clostridium beijerinckii]